MESSPQVKDCGLPYDNFPVVFYLISVVTILTHVDGWLGADVASWRSEGWSYLDSGPNPVNMSSSGPDHQSDISSKFHHSK